MKECRYCKRPLKEEEIICTFCGYDHKADTISQSFKRKAAARKKEERTRLAGGGIDPRVKKFAYIGLVITVFSLFYRYNFNINTMWSEARQSVSKTKIGKFLIDRGIPLRKKAKVTQKIELIDVRSYQGPASTTANKESKIEGIFFDPDAKSFVTIQGKVLSEGESLGSITVKKINRDSVEVMVDGESMVVGVDQSIAPSKNN